MRRFPILLTAGLTMTVMTAVAAAPAMLSAQAPASRVPDVARVIKRTALRISPRTSARSLRMLAVNEEVSVRQTRAVWTRVAARDGEGWVLSASLGSRQPRANSGQRPTEPVREQGLAAAAPREGRDDAMPRLARASTTERLESATPPARIPAPTAVRPFTIGARTWLDAGATVVGADAEVRLGAPMTAPFRPWFGVSAAADYLKASESGLRITGVVASVTANVHLSIPGAPRLDPFVGAGVGFARVTVNGAFDFGDGELQSISGSAGSNALFTGHVGARLFVTRHLAVQGAVGFGELWPGQVSAGVTWRP